jgi:uncharacterized protein (DUF1810 family)
MDDVFNLNRFLNAQQSVYESALREIKGGCKQSHWMWFIFPQVMGLGHTEISRFYSIRSPQEAAAYLAHPLLGKRLMEISAALLALPGRTATEVFGTPDDLKLRSSMTLFREVSDEPIFQKVLDRYYGGEQDPKTRQILESMQAAE